VLAVGCPDSVIRSHMTIDGLGRKEVADDMQLCSGGAPIWFYIF